MPKSRGAVKKYKTKVVSQKKKKVSKRLRTTLLPKAAEHWKEKGTVRSNYENLGIAAEINNDAAVANAVHTSSGLLQVCFLDICSSFRFYATLGLLRFPALFD